jgi:hypothetical protein
LRLVAKIGDLDERLPLFGPAVVAAGVQGGDGKVVGVERTKGQILGPQIAQ